MPLSVRCCATLIACGENGEGFVTMVLPEFTPAVRTYEILKFCRNWDSHVPKAKRFLNLRDSAFIFFTGCWLGYQYESRTLTLGEMPFFVTCNCADVALARPLLPLIRGELCSCRRSLSLLDF